MNEQEIIDYLKGNKEKGIAYNFMPSEVRCWCEEHRDETIFHVFSDAWRTLKTSILCDLDGIYCLDEDYEIEPEFTPHWEEFDVDKDGFFRIKNGSDIIYYHWFNWQKFLRENFDKYNNFGGWVYEMFLFSGDKTEVLATSPHFIDDDEELGSFIQLKYKDKVKPAYPTKILFWRHKE